MRVRAVDGTQAAATRLVAAVVEHAERVPDGPWQVSAASGAAVDAEGAVWLAEGGGVARLVLLGCRCAHAELTTFRDGVEVERLVGPAR